MSELPRSEVLDNFLDNNNNYDLHNRPFESLPKFQEVCSGEAQKREK